MQSSAQERMLTIYRKNWTWFLVFGILIEILGLYALLALTTTTLISVLLIGVLLIMGGIIVVIDSFTSWRHQIASFLLHLLLGILYIAAGALLIKHPIFGSISITFLLGIFFTIIGIFRLIDSLTFRYVHWGWVFLNGLISLLLGILIMTSWPVSGLYIIGLFVGIDLVFCGWTYIMGAIYARNYIKK